MDNNCNKDIFETHCKDEFKKLGKSITDLERRLFKDNGSPSLQTKIDRNSQWIKRVACIGAAIWAVALIVISMLIGKEI